MKKIFLIVMLLAASIFTANAQSSHWGLRTGLNFSSFGGDAVSSDARVGFHAGAYYQYMATSSFALQPEFGFSLEGDSDRSFTNMNLALVGKLFITNKFPVEFGPQLGFILSDDNFNSKAINVSLPLGASYQVGRKVSVGMRYVAGLSKVNDFGGENFKITNNTLQLSAQIRF